MGRAATGQVVVDPRRRSPTFAVRFRANGKRQYLTLGTAAEGWTEAKAQLELQNIVADVRRGTQPSTSSPRPGFRRVRPSGDQRHAQTTSGSSRIICFRSSRDIGCRRSRSRRLIATA
jgi:hypothetical protein